MIEIIIHTFEIFNYAKFTDSEVNIFKSTTMDDYWVIFQGSPNQLLEKKVQSELMAQCKKVCIDPAFEKNANIICLWNVESIDKKTIRQLHQTEEDIYFFKKNVLYYTQSELASFKEQFSAYPLQDLLQQSPTNPEIFQRYKANVNNGTWESLLYRICMKLTFIPIAQGTDEDISNLYKNHEIAMNKVTDSLLNLNTVAQNLSESELASESGKLLNLIMEQLEASE
ncbi:MAG: hypothetical protein HRU38_24515 [Saccharospirillaceae bacterium]|nr:hypothetical protein [Saccharospirillaceae bacterium]